MEPGTCEGLRVSSSCFTGLGASAPDRGTEEERGLVSPSHGETQQLTLNTVPRVHPVELDPGSFPVRPQTGWEAGVLGRELPGRERGCLPL